MSKLLTISQNQMESLLRLPLGVVSGSDATRPETAYVEVECEGKQLRARGTNTEVEIAASDTLENKAASKNVRFFVPAKKTVDILRHLPEDGEVELHLSEKSLLMKCLKNKYQLSLLHSPEDLGKEPAEGGRESDGQVVFFSSFQPTWQFRVSHHQLIHLLRSTYFSMASNDPRYFLNAALFEMSSESIRVVATDGHRLAQATLEGSFGVPLDPPPDLQSKNSLAQLIVPRKAVLEMRRLLEVGVEGDATITCGENLFQVDIGGRARLTTRLIDGRYPNYRAVFPQATDKTLVCDRQHLLGSCMRAVSVSDSTPMLQFHLSEAEDLRITSEDGSKNASEVFFDGSYTGARMEIAFRGNYLTDVLGALSGDSVKISAKDGTSSVLIEDLDRSDATYLVMPLKI